MSILKIFSKILNVDSSNNNSTSKVESNEVLNSLFVPDADNVSVSKNGETIFDNQIVLNQSENVDNFVKTSQNDSLKQQDFQNNLTSLKDNLILNGKAAGLSDEVLKKLQENEIVVQPGGSGAARYENGKIIFNYDPSRKMPSQTQITKILIHEAVHSSKNSPDNTFNTQAEEIEAETTALEVTANLVNQGKIEDDLSEYSDANNKGIKYSEFKDKNIINSTVAKWVNKNYRGVIQDKDSMAVSVDTVIGENVNQLKFKKGDVFNVNGNNFTIGENGVFLEGIQGSNVYQLCKEGVPPKTIGLILFEGTQYSENRLPAQIINILNNEKGSNFTVKQNDKLVNGKIYNLMI